MLFVIVIIFSASAKFTVYRSFDSSNNLTYMNKETAEIYNELIENSADKTLEQCDEYITDYELRSYAGGYNDNITAAVNKYKTELRSCFMVESIRSYARTQSVNIFSKTDVNSYVPIRFSKRLNTARTAPFVHRLIRNARNSFSSVKIMVNSVFRESLDDFTVSICT